VAIKRDATPTFREAATEQIDGPAGGAPFVHAASMTNFVKVCHHAQATAQNDGVHRGDEA